MTSGHSTRGLSSSSRWWVAPGGTVLPNVQSFSIANRVSLPGRVPETHVLQTVFTLFPVCSLRLSPSPREESDRGSVGAGARGVNRRSSVRYSERFPERLGQCVTERPDSVLSPSCGPGGAPSLSLPGNRQPVDELVKLLFWIRVEQYSRCSHRLIRPQLVAFSVIII